jgi:hypothetical protein
LRIHSLPSLYVCSPSVYRQLISTFLKVSAERTEAAGGLTLPGIVNEVPSGYDKARE